MTRKTISFPTELAEQISKLAIKNDRSFSKQVVFMCKSEAARLLIKRPILVISEPKKKKNK